MQLQINCNLESCTNMKLKKKIQTSSSNFMANPSKSHQDISRQTLICQPRGGAVGNVSWSPKTQGRIIEAQWISVAEQEILRYNTSTDAAIPRATPIAWLRIKRCSINITIKTKIVQYLTNWPSSSCFYETFKRIVWRDKRHRKTPSSLKISWSQCPELIALIWSDMCSRFMPVIDFAIHFVYQQPHTIHRPIYLQ